MGVWGRLTSVFGRHGSGESGLRGGIAGLAPDEPVLIKWPPPHKADGPTARNGDDDLADEQLVDEGDSDRGSATATPPAPHAASRAIAHDIVMPPSSRKPSRQELIQELRQNYTEVIDLVRKVNSHLDQQTGRIESQERRADRLAEIAEKIPEALAVLPQIRDQNERLAELSGKMVEAITDLAAATREGQDRIEEAFIEQARAAREAAERSEMLLVRNVEGHDRAVATIGDLGQSVGASSDRIAGLMSQFQASAGAREAKLADMIARGQRWLILAVVLCVSAVVVAGVAVVLLVI